MKSIIAKELKLMIKGKGNFFFLILMPMLFTVLYGSVFGNVGDTNVDVHYIDQDQSQASKAFLKQIGKIDGFTLDKSDTSQAAEVKKIKDGKISSLLVIPSGFGESLTARNSQANLKFYRDGASPSSSAPVLAVLQSIANQYEKHKLSVTFAKSGMSTEEVKNVMQPPIGIKTISKTGDLSDMTIMEQIVPGYTVMFVFFIILTMIRSFLNEKESGMLSRLRSTTMKPLEYLIGMWIPAIIAVIIQCTVLLSFGHFVYGMHLGDIGAISLLVFALAISGTGIGLAVSLLVRGENQGRGLTMLISLGGAAFAGLWVPFSMLPALIQKIGHFFPQYWAQQGLQDVIVRNGHIGDVWLPAGIMLAFGLAGLLVALLRFKHFLRTAVN
jgi:ABC-2 type transport system permease protein